MAAVAHHFKGFQVKYLIFTVAMLRAYISLPLFLLAILLKCTGEMLEQLAHFVKDFPNV